jgi:hypothetical protein
LDLDLVAKVINMLTKITLFLAIALILRIVYLFLFPRPEDSEPVSRSFDWEDPMDPETLRAMSNSIIDTLNERLNK